MPSTTARTERSSDAQRPSMRGSRRIGSLVGRRHGFQQTVLYGVVDRRGKLRPFVSDSFDAASRLASRTSGRRVKVVVVWGGGAS